MSERDGLNEQTALQLLVDNSSDMLSRHAVDGTYLWVSPASRELLGYDPDELVGRSAYELFHPEDLVAIGGSHDGVLETPDVRTVEFRIRHKDGHWLWFETTSHAVRDPETGEVLEIQTSSRDVSRRKQADAKLRESEQQFRLAMANAPIGMALVGLDGSWLEVNERLCQIVGRTREELRRLRFQDLTHPEDLDADLTQMRQLFVGDIDHYTMEKRYFHADGHIVWVLLSAAFVRDDDGVPRYGIAQLQDITLRKRWEEDLRRANAQLAASNAELERFASVASHDLRSPLATVRGWLDLVLERYGRELPDEAIDWLQRAHHNTDRLLETVDALLQLARVSNQPLCTATVHVDGVVAEVLEDLAPQLEAAGATLSVAELPAVQADRALLRLVMQNLIANAVAFRAPDRGLVITVEAADHDTTWQLQVQDNGVGFAPEDAELIFRPFRSAGSGRQTKGSGIGLATCRRIVERHGGEIHAEPLDTGARITFTLLKDGQRHV